MAFPTGYTKYQEVTIDSSKVSADLTDFPILIDLSDLSKAGDDIFDTCRSDGGDIRVTKSDGTTQLAREVVSIDTSAKTGEMLVKFSGTLSGSSDTTIRIYYNGTDTEPASDATYGSENVWGSSNKGVWHLGESSGGATDSTANGNNLTDNNTVGSGTGKIGGARDFELSNSEYLSITDENQTGLDITGDLTFEAGIKFESLPGTTSPDKYRTIISKWSSSGDAERAYRLFILNDSGTYKIYLTLTSNGVDQDSYIIDAPSLSIDTWYHLAVTWDASESEAKFYWNGSQTGSTQAGFVTSIHNSDKSFDIGGSEGSGGMSYFWDGLMDEVRVWNDVRTSTEIANNYNKELVGNESNLQGYWKLNNSLLDETSNDNDLTNNGSATFSTDVPFVGANTGAFFQLF